MKTRIKETYNGRYKPQYKKWGLWHSYDCITDKYIQSAQFLKDMGADKLYNIQIDKAMGAIQAEAIWGEFTKVSLITSCSDIITISFNGHIHDLEFPNHSIKPHWRATTIWADCEMEKVRVSMPKDELEDIRPQLNEFKGADSRRMEINKAAKECVARINKVFETEFFKDYPGATAYITEGKIKVILMEQPRLTCHSYLIRYNYLLDEWYTEGLEPEEDLGYLENLILNRLYRSTLEWI